MLYYWDDRDGSDFSGWWFGPRVGGDQASKFGRVQCHCIGTRTRVIFVNRYVLYVSLFNRYCSTICISTMHLYACIFCPYPSAPQSTNPSNQWLPLRCGQVWGYQPSTDTTPPESGWKVLQLKCTDVNDVNDLNELSNGIKKDANVCALMRWFLVIQVLEVPYDGPVDENLKVIRKKEKKEKGAKGEAVPSSSWKVQLMLFQLFHVVIFFALWLRLLLLIHRCQGCQGCQGGMGCIMECSLPPMTRMQLNAKCRSQPT